ncbi:unnamed protein product, partial [Vitis vinifera]|uniref:Uncharacterized protein n=1 Tax=Vitis vinifera TaxID=29760 RepID=E0CW18_VITVI
MGSSWGRRRKPGSTCIGEENRASYALEEILGSTCIEGRKKSGDKRGNRAPNRPFFNLSSSLFVFHLWVLIIGALFYHLHRQPATTDLQPGILFKKRVKPSFDLWVDILGSGFCWWAPKALTCGLK